MTYCVGIMQWSECLRQAFSRLPNLDWQGDKGAHHEDPHRL